MHHTLSIELDEHGWAWLRCRTSDQVEEHGFALRAGFDVYHVWEAVLATGWVARQADGYELAGTITCGQLRDVTAEMFAHFTRPEEPGPQLRHIARRLAALDLDPPLPADLSWWALAWLDVMLREDLADAARSAEAIWSDNILTLDIAERRTQRWMEVMARYAAAEPPATGGRMSASYRARRGTLPGSNERAG